MGAEGEIRWNVPSQQACQVFALTLQCYQSVPDVQEATPLVPLNLEKQFFNQFVHHVLSLLLEYQLLTS